MIEPQKLNPKRLAEIEMILGELLSHVAALEQERDKWKTLGGEWMSGFADSCLERDAARARAEAAEARVKVLEEELRWQPIETAPKDGTVILMTDGVVVSAGHWKGPDPQWVEWRPNWIVAHFVHSSPVINENITHWMPLPALSPPVKEPSP